ncbi:transporter substrate-binding domain-containing protein [Streptomyces sp. NPDC018000]|uniref:transporter substrate-binding domain-containing protein n=1 Tax=Streptomyces sp. NPDC018000 TaxID=3365028 RepID=UPI00379FE76E
MNNWRPNARRAACALGTAVLLAVTVSCDEPEHEPSLRGAPRVNVGYKGDQPGTSYKDESSNAFDGFEVELGHHIEKGLKTRFTPFDLTSKDRVEALKKDVDLVLATFSVEDKRIEQVDFAGIYMKTLQGLLVWGETSEYESKGSGMTVCTLENSTSYDILTKNPPNELSEVEVESRPKIRDCVGLLEEGEVQGISTDQVILYGLAKDNGDFRVVPGLTFGPPQYYGVGIKKQKKDRGDCREVQEIVDDYVESNAWEQNFKIKLPLADEAEGFRKFRPTRNDSNLMSCRDEVGP